MNLPTFPARPVNGGALEVALPKRGDWRYEPKYNGWRALVHIPTGEMFNRQLERLSIEGDFYFALAALATAFPHHEWADCEALERRHAIGKGTLILLDLITSGTYVERRWTMLLGGLPTLEVSDRPKENALYTAPSYDDPQLLWQRTAEANKNLNAEFYEGIVAKRADSKYPIQRISANRETTDWIKHRWKH
jgi:hypothetical protein